MGLTQEEISAIADEVVRRLLPLLAAPPVELSGRIDPKKYSLMDRGERKRANKALADELRRAGKLYRKDCPKGKRK